MLESREEQVLPVAFAFSMDAGLAQMVLEEADHYKLSVQGVNDAALALTNSTSPLTLPASPAPSTTSTLNLPSRAAARRRIALAACSRITSSGSAAPA